MIYVYFGKSCVLCVFMIYHNTHKYMFSVNNTVNESEKYSYLIKSVKICSFLHEMRNRPQPVELIRFCHLTCRTENKTQALRAREWVCESEIKLSALIISVLGGPSKSQSLNPKWPSKDVHFVFKKFQHSPLLLYLTTALLHIHIFSRKCKSNFAMTHFIFLEI